MKNLVQIMIYSTTMELQMQIVLLLLWDLSVM